MPPIMWDDDYYDDEEPEPEEPESFGKNRVCSWSPCETILSIYNDSDRCHEHPHRKILLPERKIRR